MTAKFLVSGLTALLLMACQPSTEAQTQNQQAEEKIKETQSLKNTPFDTQYLQSMGFQVQSVAESNVEGVYEVITQRGLVHVANNGQTLIGGHMYDITGAEPLDLSDRSLDQMRREELQSLEDEMIIFEADDQKHVVTVFTDPSCGYCRELHNNIDSYLERGITIRYMAWPRGGTQSMTANLMRNVWCAEDPQAALTAAKNDQRVKQAQCDAPINEHYNLGIKFGVRGTPAIVLENGHLIPGLVPASDLLSDIEMGRHR